MKTEKSSPDGASKTTIKAAFRRYRTPLLLGCAAIAIVFAVALLLWHRSTYGGLNLSVLSGQAEEMPLADLDEAALPENETALQLLPWVEADELLECREFSLESANAWYEAGDTVIYYALYVSDGVTVSVYVESARIFAEELDSFKQPGRLFGEGPLCFVLPAQAQAGCTDAYFEINAYKYNLRLQTEDAAIVESLLRKIEQSFFPVS